MNSTAVKCLRWGVLECVKSKTHDECAFGRLCVCVCEGRNDRVVNGERVRTGKKCSMAGWLVDGAVVTPSGQYGEGG